MYTDLLLDEALSFIDLFDCVATAPTNKVIKRTEDNEREFADYEI